MESKQKILTYRVSSSGYMNAAIDTVNPFQLSETAFQVRYKYEFLLYLICMLSAKRRQTSQSI